MSQQAALSSDVETDSDGRERRRELRQQPVSGTAEIDGKTYTIFDWSSSGVCLSDCDRTATAGERVPTQIKIETADAQFEFASELLFVRISEDNKAVAGVFVSMPRKDRVAVTSHFEDLEQAMAPKST